MQCFGRGCCVAAVADHDGSISNKPHQQQQQQHIGKKKQQQRGANVDREALRAEHMQQHGHHILAISTLQQSNMDYFVVPDVGYIAFAWMFNGPEPLNIRTPVALSDPVAHPQHWRALAAAFVEAHPAAIFVQTSYEFAEILAQLGFACNSMGGETRFDLATYEMTGYARRGLRSAISGATKEGLVVSEVMPPPAGSLGPGPGGVAARDSSQADWQQLAAEMAAVDEEWGRVKGSRARSAWFLNRPPIYAPEPGVRKLVARGVDGRLQAFIFFDGVFEGGRLAGYYANVTRIAPEAHPGALNLLMRHFIDLVRSELQLAKPAKRLSMSRTHKKRLEAAAAAAGDGAAAAAGGPDTTAQRDQDKLPAASRASAAAAKSAKTHDSANSSTDSSTTNSSGSSGPRFLSLGLSPFCQMDNGRLPHCAVTDALLRFTFDAGEAFYPFATLAAAKAKYGAGLHGGKYEDPAVEYRQAYLCHRRSKATAPAALFDVGKLFGLWDHPADCFSRYLAFRARQGVSKLKQRMQKKQPQCASGSTSGSATSASRAPSEGKSAGGSSPPSERGSTTSTTRAVCGSENGRLQDPPQGRKQQQQQQ